MSNLNHSELDIVYYKTQDGLVMKLDSLSSSYSLDEIITGKFFVTNISNTTKFHIVSSSGPLAVFHMYDKNGQQVNYTPRFRTGTYYDFYFKPGDTLKSSLSWNHITYSNNHFNDLKAFAGDYYIKIYHTGIPSDKLIKWIRISEIGDPLSTILYWDFTHTDSLKLEFILRNRISNDIQYELIDLNPVEIEIYDDVENSLIRSYFLTVDFLEIISAGKTDQVILSYNISYKDPVLSNLKGSYICRINIYCKSKLISAETSIIIKV